MDERSKDVLEWIAQESAIRDVKVALVAGAEADRVVRRKRFSETWDEGQRFNAQESVVQRKRQKFNALWQMREPVGFFGCEGLMGIQTLYSETGINPQELVVLSRPYVDAPTPYRR